MKKLILALAFLSSAAYQIQAQDVFTYGKNAVSKAEFDRAYSQKNASTKDFYTYKGLRNYVDLYALFKMKVADAKELGIDTMAIHRNDLNQYKVQLAKSYLADASVNDILLKEAYDRSKNDVEIAHIQISVRGNDTLQSYDRIMFIYKEIENGSLTFEAAAAKYSEDHASKNNGGNIGYISALDVFYPIENVAYTTAPGKYAPPVRTHVGYHIVKVLSKRPSKGQVQVAQILVLANPKDAASVEVAKAKADNYYQQLKGGADFTNMVKNHSEDKFSINNNGNLPAFATGKMDINIENAAFDLKKVGDFSAPIQTEFGFHILKLVKKIPVPSFDEAKDDLTTRLKNDKRVEIAEKAMKEKQLLSMGYKENEQALNELVEVINQDTAKVPKLTVAQFQQYTKPLFSLDKHQYTQLDFITFIVDATNGNLYGRREKTVRDLYKMYNDKMIGDYQIALLEKNNPSFIHTLQEYQEANMIFALMEQRIWAKALNDAAGLNAYYERNKSNYKYKEGFGGNIFESSSQTSLGKIQAMLAEGMDPYDALTNINNEGGAKVTMQSGKYEYNGMPAKVSGLVPSKMSEIYTADNGNFFFIMPEVTFPENTIKSFEESRGLVISDYQSELEKEWATELKNKYPLTVNEKTLKSLVKKK